MTATLTRIALTLLLLGLGRPAAAGPGDTPLPTFADGTPAQAVYTAFGLIKNNNLETDFVCTNLDAAPVDIGIQVFDETGALRNNVAAAGPLCNAGSRAGQACTVDNSTDTVNGCPGALCPACCVLGSGGDARRGRGADGDHRHRGDRGAARGPNAGHEHGGERAPQPP